ncbi:MAG: endonuclease/exonuclease/phosphatase family protein, partial [Proteobacteria bacterium]|nr:endonuclease/exonuclease/phosphatase family protein [Pseudomonadota bacterium]
MIRLATFNVENLFDRPEILNMKDQDKARELLDKLAELQRLLAKEEYSTADKARIFELYNALSKYIEIQEDVGKLFRRAGVAIVGVSASGAGTWYGGIQLKQAHFGDQQRTNTASMIKKINADIQCLIEVEGNQVLDTFNSKMLNRRFRQHLSIDSPIDPRGIDIGLYLRNAEMGRIRTNVFDRVGNKSVWSRDCLEVECRLASGQSLFLLVNHFKSKFGGDTPDALAKRKGQAER